MCALPSVCPRPPRVGRSLLPFYKAGEEVRAWLSDSRVHCLRRPRLPGTPVLPLERSACARRCSPALHISCNPQITRTGRCCCNLTVQKETEAPRGQGTGIKIHSCKWQEGLEHCQSGFKVPAANGLFVNFCEKKFFQKWGNQSDLFIFVKWRL